MTRLQKYFSKRICIIATILVTIILFQQTNLFKQETRKKFKYLPSFDVDDNFTTPNYVIFDFGANIGDSARFFADPIFKNTDKPPFHELKGFCVRKNKICTIHSFEANPRFNNHLENAKKIIESFGHSHILYKESAAWIKDENLTFYLDTVSVTKNYWGSSLHKEFVGGGDQLKVVNARGFDVSKLIDNYSNEDFIIVKVDIEGTEFPLIEHLIRQGTIHKIDYLTVEFHNVNFKNNEFEEKLQFYKNFLNFFKIKHSQWFLAHAPYDGYDF